MSNINYNINKINKLTPFKFFCLTNFPFIEEDFDALTYYELLCKVVGYLNKVIDTTNAIGTQTEELTNAFNELKSYVDNYFTNLDVQQEINNKLDEMAESGFFDTFLNRLLTQTYSFSYPNIEAMKEDTSLVSNNKVIVYGGIDVNDGGNAKYIIVDDNSLIDDNDNIILLNNGLYAIKIKEQIFPNFFLASFFEDVAPYKTNWFVSLDGLNYTKLNVPFTINARDISIQYNENDNYFYVCTAPEDTTQYDFMIRKSKDLKTWESKQIRIGLTGTRKWAPDLFIDNEENKMYVLISNDYGFENDVEGRNIPAFDIYITECLNNETLDFSNARKLNLGESPNRNHIDGSLSKYNNIFYLVVKNEYNKINEIFSTTDLINFTLINPNVTKSNLWVEGAQIIFTETYVYYMADCFTNGRYIVSKIPISEFPNFKKFTPCETLNNQRHGSLLYINTKIPKKVISEINGFSFNGNNNLEKKHYSMHVISSTNEPFLHSAYPVMPNAIYLIKGDINIDLNLVNVFDIDYMELMFAGGNTCSITINSLNGTALSKPIIIRNNRALNEKRFKLPLKFEYLPFECINFNTTSLSSSDITVNSNFSLLHFNATKIGNIISLSFEVKCNVSTYEADGSTVSNLIQLPVNWRPSNNLLIQCNRNLPTMQLLYNGQVEGGFKCPKDGNTYFTITYPCYN